MNGSTTRSFGCLSAYSAVSRHVHTFLMSEHATAHDHERSVK